MGAFEEHRFKVISLDEHFLLDVLNWCRNPRHFFTLPITEELPEDCTVVSLQVSWERRCIEAMVCSMSFPPVEGGVHLERIPGPNVQYRLVPFLCSRCEEAMGAAEERKCRYCGCTDSKCIEATGEPCYWAAPDRCCACEGRS